MTHRDRTATETSALVIVTALCAGLTVLAVFGLTHIASQRAHFCATDENCMETGQ